MGGGMARAKIAAECHLSCSPSLLPPPKTMLLLVNPMSGGKKGRSRGETVKAKLGERGIIVTVYETTGPNDAMNHINKVDLQEYDSVGVVGGDGTLHETMNGVFSRADSDEIAARVVFGHFPSGTGNNVSLSMGVRTLEDTIENIIQGSVANIDLVVVSDAKDDSRKKFYSLNLVGTAASSACISLADQWRWMGMGANYELGFAQFLLGNPNFYAKFDIPDYDYDKHVLHTCYNGPELETRLKEKNNYSYIQSNTTVFHGGNDPFAHLAKMDDGLMDLILIERQGRVGFLNTMLGSKNGSQWWKGRKKVIMLQVSEYTIYPLARKKGQCCIEIDGEINCDGEGNQYQDGCNVKCLQGKVKMFCPGGVGG